jgi:hypothetical protein
MPYPPLPSPFGLGAPAISPFGIGKQPPGTVGMSTPNGTQYLPDSNGVKANAPGDGKPKSPVLPKAMVSKNQTTSQPQTTQGTQGSTGTYQGVPITGSNQSDIQAQMARIDAQGASQDAATINAQKEARFNAGQDVNTGQALTQRPAQQQNQPPAPVDQSYGGQIGSLLRNSQNTYSQGNANAQRYSQQADQLNQQLSQMRQNEASALAQNASNPIPLTFQQGREQILQNQYGAQENALSNQLLGNQNLYNSSLTGQGQGLTGQNEAAGLSKPTVENYGQTSFDPQTQQFGNGGGGQVQPNDPLYPALQQYAKLYASGQQGAIPSSITSNPVLNAQVLQMAQQQNPNFNYNTAVGQATAQQNNTATAGTAQIGTAASGYGSTSQAYNSLNAAFTAANTQAQTLQSILDRTQINSGNSTDWNTAINNLGGRFSSTDQAQFKTSMAELQNMYSALLSQGGTTPSGTEQQALSVLNPNSSAAAINASIYQLQNAAQARLSAAQGLANTYGNTLGIGGGDGGNGGGSISGFGWHGQR